MKKSILVLLILFGCGTVPNQSDSMFEKIPVSFKASVLLNSGEIVPVSQAKFVLSAYTLKDIKLKSIENNQPGPSPSPVEKPNEDYYHHIIFSPASPDSCAFEIEGHPELKNIDVTEQAKALGIDPFLTKNMCYITYLKKKEFFNRYKISLELWEAKAYQGIETIEAEELKLLEKKGYPNYTFQTDLNGKAEFKISAGVWYVSGEFKLKKQSIIWQDAPFRVEKESNLILLSNDNSTF
jgi:hypothetical protein